MSGVSKQSDCRAISGRAERLAALQAQLTDAVRAIVTGPDWLAWLSFAARFHHYSFHNQLLIRRACPHATQVAGYTAWARLDRQVRRGERGIPILAPCTYRSQADPDPDQPPPDPAAPPVVRGFKIVHVFDVSQTDGDAPLPAPPTPQELTGQAPAGLLDRLIALIGAHGYHYSRGLPSHPTAYGETDVAQRAVVVRADIDDAHAAKVTLHELAHVLLHTAERDPGCRGRIEVEAESVAYLVCTALGLPTAAYSAPYVASWATGDLALVSATAQRVTSTAHLLLDQLTGTDAADDLTPPTAQAVR